MDTSIFKKMKLKPEFTVRVLFTPQNYPAYEEYARIDTGQADFVHLFVESREGFVQRFPQAAKACKEGGLFWVSYPKSKGKITFNINRDSIWDLLLAENFHPVAQISLDEDWSAVRVKGNEIGVVYERPNNVKK